MSEPPDFISDLRAALIARSEIGAIGLNLEYENWRSSRADPDTRLSAGPAAKAYDDFAAAEDAELTRRGEPRVFISMPVMVGEDA
jgi:hypothetical protein